MDHGHSHGGGCGHSHGSGPPPPSSPKTSSAAPKGSDDDENERLLYAGIVQAEKRPDRPAGSLREEFLRAERLYHHVVDDIGECDGEHSVDKHVNDALVAFTRCSAWVRSEGIFSSNESLDDISTSSLQYLLIEFYIATLRQRRMTNRYAKCWSRLVGTPLARVSCASWFAG
jgi:hypothetical protein